MSVQDKTATILIVDDLKLNLELMGDLLCDSYKVQTADSGFKALEILRAAPDAVDVILLDMIMPRMNGCEFLEQMKSQPEICGIPVIAMTTDDDPYTKMRAFDLGAVDFVRRGADAAEIKRRVANVLRLSRLEKMAGETERLKSENEHMKKAADNGPRFTAFMDNIPGGVAIMRTDGNNVECSYFNKELLMLFGMTSAEFKAQFTDKTRPEWIKTFVREQGFSQNFSFIFAVGDANSQSGCQWVRVIAGKLGEQEGVSDIYCVFLDSNDEKRHEMLAKEAGEKLRENEDRLGALLDNSPGGIVYAERDNYGKINVMFVNRGLAEMLEYPTYESCLEELCGDPAPGLTPYDVSIMRKKLDQTLKEGGHMTHAFNCNTKNGKPLWLMLRAKPMMNSEGNLCLYAFVTNATKEKQIENELRTVAYFDPLTGLYNRSAFIMNVRQELDEHPLNEYSMIKLNIGSFKTVNDLMGRELGDRVLCTVASVLREIMGGGGIYARFFADNFCMLVPYSERGVHPQMIIDALKSAMKEIPEITHEIQFYLGVYKITDKSLSVENMTDRASIACRSINGSFREHIVYYDEKMRMQMLEEQEIVDDSRHALENGEFYVCYQPVYGIKAGRFVSAEALVRWNHPTKGMISPGKFIPVFEKNGFIAELDLYVLEQVCIYQKKRMENGLDPFPISVNISRMSMYNPKLFDIINNLTARYHIAPQNFRIEITESAYNDNPVQLLETVGRLRGNCFPVLMDDFGSGYSSLNTLKDIPIDILKLDMKFMQGFENNAKVGTIVTSIARMSKWLNVPMLAEGVETREQYEFLASIGCAYIQGFYFSRPIPEKEFTMLIQQGDVMGDSENTPKEDVTIGYDVNELLGSNPLVSKFIESVCGGLGIYEMTDGAPELIRANEGYERIMGYAPEEALEENTDIYSHIHPDDVEISRNACLEAIRTDAPVKATVRRYAKDGRLLTLEGIHRRLGGSDDSPIFCIAFTDITDTLRSNRIIKRTIDRTERLLSTTGSSFLEIDFENNDVFHAGSVKPFDIEIKSVADFDKAASVLLSNAHPYDVDKLREIMRSRTEVRSSVEARVKDADGGYYWWRFTNLPVIGEAGDISGVIFIITDINAEKIARLQLEEQNISVTAALDNLSSGVLVLEATPNGTARSIYSNGGLKRVLGYPETADGDIVEFMERELPAVWAKEIREGLSDSSSFIAEHDLARADGKTVRIEISVSLSSQKESGERTYVVFVSDVTERYKNAQKLAAIVNSYNGGIALINTAEDNRIEYANDDFYSLVALGKNDDKRLKLLINEILTPGVRTRDLRIHKSGSSRVVRTRVFSAGANSQVIRVNDVTRSRLELKDRINERMENAAAGMYDVVFEMNLKMRTIRLVSTNKEFFRSIQGKVLPMESVAKQLQERFVYPDDEERMRELIEMPFGNPDFTDAYREVRFLVPDSSGKYSAYGVTLVRAKADACMLFCRDKSRVDSMVVNSKVADLSRLYRTVADSAKITLIEWDHVTNRTICSPSIEEFWAAKLSVDEFYRQFDEGLVVHDEDKKTFKGYMERLNASSGTPEKTTIRLKMADGSYKWCELSITLNRASDGSVMRSLCTIKQLDREAVEKKRQESGMQLLHKTVDNIPVGLGVFRLEDGKASPLYISDKIYQIFGMNSRNMDIPVLPLESIARDSGFSVGADGRCALESMRVDGTAFDLAIRYKIAREEDQTLIYAVFSDITEQVSGSRRSAAENEMYGMLLYDTGTITFSYSLAKDEFSYCRSDGKRTSTVVLDGFMKNPERLALLDSDDRAKLIHCISRLSESKDGKAHEEMLVRIEVDGYRRRYKVLVKTVVDEQGRVFAIIGKMEDVDDELSRLEKVEAKAMYDPLCVDVYNRATTEELIKTELERGTGGVLMILDIDDFKSINDTLGHLFGDEVLKKFAYTVKGVFRATDIVGRYGGDEFIVFLPRATAALAKKKGCMILERIIAIELPQLGAVKSSIGAAVVNPVSHSYSEVFKQADTALYQAKNNGKNRVEVFNAEDMDEGVYRTSGEGRASNRLELSSNPGGASSLMMRVFSALYSSIDIDAGIEQILALVGKSFDVSRVYIFEDSEDGKFCHNTFEWCGEEVESVKDMLQNVDYDNDLDGMYHSCYNDEGIIYCEDITTLPDKICEILDVQGVKAVLHCAIMDEGRFKGFVGFDECRNNRNWTKEQIDSLVFLSKIISVFLLKGRSEQKERLK